jgi:hypothetical protein
MKLALLALIALGTVGCATGDPNRKRVLLVPPITHNHVVANAPLAQWTVVGTYPDWNSCLDVLVSTTYRISLAVTQDFNEYLGNHNPTDGYLPRCVRSDDPELGGNAAAPQR